MVNYKMRFTVSEVSQILKVEKELIKEWAYTFGKYLSPTANPTKGKLREFQVEDIRVMAYIFTYWEDEPDIENIKFGLNSEDYRDNELIDNLITGITPLFIEPPDDIDESWKHGIIFYGLSEFGDTFVLANSYKLAGDRLIEAALSNEENLELFCPAIYNYRHATELYLKAIIGNFKQTHNLEYLYSEFKKRLKSEFDSTPPQWLENIIKVFDKFDSSGTAFRYGGGVRDEIFVDFNHLKQIMHWLSQSFRNIRRHQGMPDADYHS